MAKTSTTSTPCCARLSMAAELSPEWLRLRCSLQSADDFALYFVFTDSPTQNQLGLDYLNEALELRTLRLRVVRPDTPERLVEDTLAALFSQAHGAHPVWVECWRDARSADWNVARRQLLARLNEGRGRLESSFAAPLILLLPYESAKITAEAAPDLWSVRRRTLYLHQTAPDVAERPAENAPVPAVSPELAARAQGCDSKLRTASRGALFFFNVFPIISPSAIRSREA